MTSAAILTLGSAVMFAADTTITSSNDIATYSQTTSLASGNANAGDSVKIASDVDAEPFVTSLYYGSSPVTQTTDQDGTINYIYDADWNAEESFTTADFTVVVTGSAGNQGDTAINIANQINMTITATPFIQTDGSNVKAGQIEIINVGGNGGTVDSDANAAPTTITDATITAHSDALRSGFYYEGYAATHSNTPDATTGKIDGNIFRFKIKNVGGNDTLPSGRYVSTVTLSYSAE